MASTRILTRATVAALMAYGAVAPAMAQEPLSPVRGIFFAEPSIRIITVTDDGTTTIEAQSTEAKSAEEAKAKPDRAKSADDGIDDPLIAIQKLQNGKLDPETMEKLQRIVRERNLHTGGMFHLEMPTQAYWLGVECRSIDPVMRKPLKLAGEAGIVVGRVLENGPAAKAGLVEGDILIAVGEEPLTSVEQLIVVVQKSEGRELTLEVQRGEKHETIKLQAEKRTPDGPQENVKRMMAEARMTEQRSREEAEKARKAYEDWAKQMQAQGFAVPAQPAANGTLNILRAAPGIVLPQRLEPAKTVWPDELEITVTRKGNAPATITLENGDEKVTLTEDKVDQFSPKMRVFVEEMLGRKPFTISLQQGASLDAGGNVRFSVTMPKQTEPTKQPEGLHKVVIGKHEHEQPQGAELKQMQEQLQRMQKQLDAIQKQTQKQKTQD